MNNDKITNPLLKQIISNIANKANEGRMKDINWTTLAEPKKVLKEGYDWRDDPVASRKFEKSDVSPEEYDEYIRNKRGYKKYQPSYSPRKASFKGITFFNVPSGKESLATQVGLSLLKSGKWGFKHRQTEMLADKEVLKRAEQEFGAGRYWEPKNQVNEVDGDKKEKTNELPSLDGGDETSDTADADKPTPDADKPAPDAENTPTEPEPDSGEDADEAQADAVKAKAELEKAKAEKDQAEKELKKQSYIKLASGAGTQFMISKILNHAFKTNTIDSLASEMVQKLKIQTPEDMVSFSEDTAPYRVIPGMPELLSSMKTMATKQPETPEA
jgi:hypothetical protein